MLFFYIL